MINELIFKLEEAYAKIEDLENWSHLYNIPIRGLPVNTIGLEKAVFILMKDLIPDILPHQMEIDRVHRALTIPRSDGLSRNVIAKPHYYRIKELMVSIARSCSDLTFHGSTIQIFADLAPYTIQRRKNLKPLLQQLLNHQIKYLFHSTSPLPLRVHLINLLHFRKVKISYYN